ncbi:MAG: nitroreductase family protein [Deltaproteobacteria bacterium]|nr:nitroreductase family protein [Deltaproteobacteria bacterium]
MIKKILQTRRSIRSFKPDAITDNELLELIEMAVSAPSAGNRQPWLFFIIKNRAVIGRMAEVIRLKSDEMTQSVSETFRQRVKDYSAYFTRFEGAPVVIVCVWRDF